MQTLDDVLAQSIANRRVRAMPALVVVGGAVLMTYAAARGTRRVDPLAALKME